MAGATRGRYRNRWDGAQCVGVHRDQRWLEHADRCFRHCAYSVWLAHVRVLGVRGDRRAGVRRDALLDHQPSPFQASEAGGLPRSEEHTSELQSLMRISYAVFCLKKKKPTTYNYTNVIT